MPVSHSSSAALSSSFSFSHLSQIYTSSSSSSSSPDHSVFYSSQVPPPLSTVPFLWEEKPGVVKKDMETIMIEGHALLQEASEISSDAGGFLLGSTSQDDQAGLLSNSVVHHRSCSSHKIEKMRKDPSKKLSRSFVPPAIFITDGRTKALAEAKSLPRLPPPPCLIVPRSLENACFQDNCDARLHYRPGRHHGHGSASNSVVPTAGSTFSLHKRRHQRHASLEDDPFWVAMVACTKEATTSDDDAGCQSRKNSRERSLSRSNSWLLKKASGQGEINIGVHFDQCLPRRALLKRFTRPEKGASKDDTYVSTYKVSMATNIAGTSHLTAQAFKALSLAKASLHDRCKIMLNQSGATELLDISSTSRGSSFNKKKKNKLPIMDLFGCKSDLPLCGRPIIPAPP